MSQIKITIDHNNDLVNMDGTEFKITGSMLQIKNFLIELFNVIEPSNLILEEINEDTRRIVDEW